jgi:hypothetical protein
MARMDQGRRAREGVADQGTVNNSVIVPEELTAGVIAGGLERGPGSAPRGGGAAARPGGFPGRADISRIFAAGTGTNRT